MLSKEVIIAIEIWSLLAFKQSLSTNELELLENASKLLLSHLDKT